MPPKKQQLDQTAWQWAEDVEPASITKLHIETAYRVTLKSCKLGTCRRNCKGNPRCVNALGESRWFADIPDNVWHEVEDPKTERREQGAFAGLKNLGATCYVNTFLQVWFQNPEIRQAVFGWQEHTDLYELSILEQDLPTLKTTLSVDDLDKLLTPQNICEHLQNIFALLQFSKRRYIDPTPFINSLGLDAGLQQDAQEFSKLFMSLLEDTLYQKENPEARNFIHQFMGQYQYVTRCSSCTSESRRPSNFYELDLNIKGHKNLNDCIEEFLKEERLEGDNQYMCSSCVSKQNATRSIQLKTIPKVLNLQLLRFVFERQTGHKKKLNTYIEFPETLDMSGYLTDMNAIYHLAAVLIHRGPSAYSGHYVAHIKDPSSETWYKFNDEQIEKMGGKNLQLGNEDDLEGKGPKKPKTTKGSHASRNAYMLVYHLKDSKSEKKCFNMPVQESSISNNEVNEASTSSSSANQMPQFKDQTSSSASQSVNNNEVSNIQTVVPFESLPLRIQRHVQLDNERFEEWVADMTEMRDQSVSKGKSRQTEVKEIFSMLPWSDGDPFCWIKTDWITKWLTSESVEQIPEIETKDLFCSHQKLDPDKVPKAKCISKQSGEILFSKYGGNLKLDTDSLCMKCVKERCCVIRTKARMNEDNKAITAFTKLKDEELNPSQSYWVGKSSLRSWKRLALEQLQQLEATNNIADKHIDGDDGCNEITGIENGHLHNDTESTSTASNHCDKTPTTTSSNNPPTSSTSVTSSSSQSSTQSQTQSNSSSKQESQPASMHNEGLQFNEDILCENHDKLTIEEGARRLVPEDIWLRLKWYFPNAAEYRGDAELCVLCKSEVEEEQRLKSLHRTMAAEQKAALNDLYLDKKRPNWEDGTVQLNVISANFLDQWRKFIRDPQRALPPQVTDNSSMLCPHGGFLYNPETIGLDDTTDRLCMIYPNEWAVLKQYTNTDVEITITRIQEDAGYVTFIVTPDICRMCQEARENEEMKSKLNYTNAVIFVRKLTSSGKIAMGGNVPMETLKEGESLLNNKGENGSNDSDFLEESCAKRRKSCSEEGPAAGENVVKPESVCIRRSSRHRKVRGEKEVTVSSTNTLRDLKLQIMKLFSVAPFDQNLTLDGHVLSGDQETLESLKVMPGAVIYLKADEPVEDPSFLDDISKASYPEEGFKGTGLLSRS